MSGLRLLPPPSAKAAAMCSRDGALQPPLTACSLLDIMDPTFLLPDFYENVLYLLLSRLLPPFSENILQNTLKCEVTMK